VTGYDLIWAVVPNKSTTYLYPDKRFWDEADKLGMNSVNLLQVMRQAVASRVVDLYPGDETHLSTTGYILMGQAIYRQMQR
jgi:lysophospholipase L1-like esterase